MPVSMVVFPRKHGQRNSSTAQAICNNGPQSVQTSKALLFISLHNRSMKHWIIPLKSLPQRERQRKGKKDYQRFLRSENQISRLPLRNNHSQLWDVYLKHFSLGGMDNKMFQAGRQQKYLAAIERIGRCCTRQFCSARYPNEDDKRI